MQKEYDKLNILKQIIPLFPKNINNFYDVFAWGCNVGINVNANKIFLNDINKKVINLYPVFKEIEFSNLLNKIENIIISCNLSNTKLYGYDYYNVDSSKGLKSVNKTQYLKLRDDYNNGKFSGIEKNIVLYVLIVYAFNN